ncbi:hypothetical protein [Micromonospora sp. NBC_01739]|uniref:hypothetical protein n=1 Tax=unclassified Micromonospora TaxID=2617518 RepID=UPI002E11A8A4|nr:hypothetical protein OIE53_19820 [Micromonospora sp. NBC_01739]
MLMIVARVMVNAADQSRLAVLISDYEMARDDERSFVGTMAALIGVAVALATAVVAAVSQTCTAGQKEECFPVHDAVLAATPLPTLAVLAYMQMIGIVATMRSYYMRAIEKELQTYAVDPLVAVPALRPASLIGVTTEIISLRRGRLAFRLLSLLIYFCVVVVFGGLAVYVALRLNQPWQLIMFLIYGLFALLFTVEVMATAVGGNSLFFRYTTKYASRTLAFDRPGPPFEGERRLWSYLLVPRTADWVKWIMVPALGGLLVWAGSLRLGSDDLITAVVVIVALEVFVYPARYQWNDIIGLADDVAHPARRARKRLPVGNSGETMRRNVRRSAVAALARVALALGGGAFFGLWWVMTCLTGAVFGVAVLYEALRRRPASERPEQTTSVTVAIWLAVGLGYVLRATVACWLVGLGVNDARTWLVAGAFGAFGVMFVTLTWALEASSYCRDVGGEIQYAPELRAKPQCAALLPYTGKPVARGRHHKSQADCGGKPLLEKRGRLISPWNIAALTAFLLSAPLGVLLADGLDMPAADTRLGWVALATAFAAVAMLISGSTRVRTLVLIAGAGGIAATLYGLGLQPGFGVAPWLVFAGCYAGFRSQSYVSLTEGLKDLARRVLRAIGTLWKKTRSVLVGKRTEELLWKDQRGATP